MRLLVVGRLNGQIAAAVKMAMQTGAKVAHVETCAAATQALRSGQGADLLMVDYDLDIAGLIAANESERIRVPVVACGMSPDPRRAADAIRAGAKEVIPLPPDAELSAAILAAVATDDAVAVPGHQERRGIDTGEALDHVARLAHRRRHRVRPRRGLEKLGRFLAIHACAHAALLGELVGAADHTARIHVLALADAGARRRDGRHRHAEPVGIGEAADARLVLADAGIVVDGRAAAELGRHIGGVGGAVAAADHDGARRLGRQLDHAVVYQDRDVHRRAVYIAAMSATVDNKVSVLILQHPQEQDRVLGTAGLIASTLGNARVVVGLSWRNLAHALKEPAEAKDWGVLYLGSTQVKGRAGPLVAVDRKGEPLADQATGLAGLKGLVALDGNWAQAKALWWRNAWLTRLRRFVVVPDGPSLYGNLRREARPDAVSTLEAVALSLQALEGDVAVREALLAPFRELLAKARAAGVRDSKRDRRRH